MFDLQTKIVDFSMLFVNRKWKQKNVYQFD